MIMPEMKKDEGQTEQEEEETASSHPADEGADGHACSHTNAHESCRFSRKLGLGGVSCLSCSLTLHAASL